MTSEIQLAISCTVCGTPVNVGCEHTKQNTEESQPELTRERLADMMNLEIKVNTDFGPLLEELKTATGADLQPRSDGFHLTIIGPTEYKILSTLDDDKIAELQKISEQIQKGDGVAVKGIGFIDGASSQYKLKEADKAKKTAFVAFDVPALQEFREKVGLPKKDFHITIGFVGNDIYTHIVGQEPVKPGSPKMKDVTALIPKQADQRFASITLPEISYGGLDGQIKEQK